MLSFVNIKTPIEVKEYVDRFDLHSSTWIVSDLKSKTDIQNQCLQQCGYYLDDSILRISDFWRLWLRRLYPEIAVVSSDFIKILVQNFMNSEQIKSISHQIDLEEHQYSTIYNYMTELAPIILSPQSDEIIQEWMKNKNKSWFKWYFVARLCLNYLVKEKKVVESRWVSSLLQNADVNLIQWSKHIYLDLGSEMTSVEMGLFTQIAQKTNVTVFVPDPSWKDKYKFLLNTYALNKGYSKTVVGNGSQASQPSLTNQYSRLATEALEVKFIVSRLRSWIEQGVLLENIGLVSPRLEDYWPLLKLHLDEEGISYNKKNVTALNSLGSFQSLLSRFKSLTRDVSWESLEQTYYGDSNNEITIEYEKFKSQFIELTDAEDLARNDEIKKIFFNKINLKDKVSRLQFLAVLFKLWTEMKLVSEVSTDALMPQNVLDIAFKDFLSRTIETELYLDQWIKIFSSALSQKELSLQKASLKGVDIGSVNANHLMNVEYMIWFGLDESGFKKSLNTLIPIDDIEHLKFNFDFPINYPEESHTEFNIRWFSEYLFKEQIFTCSVMSSQAEPLNASALILENNINPDIVFEVSENATRIDSLQIEFARVEPTEKLKNESFQHEIKIPFYKPTELSMTDFINFDHCGFKLLAAKGFRLKDYPVHSIDLDHRQRGSIIHALFEFLITENRYQSYDPLQTETFLEDKRKEFKLYIQMDNFWGAQKSKLLDTAKRFCEFEKKRIGGLGLKHFLEAEFKLPLKTLTLSGRIDRIDQYPDQSVIIYDYKRSNGDTTSYGCNWIDKHEFQMLFYILAAQDMKLGPDRGAYYFFYKNMEIYKGLIDQAAAEDVDYYESIEPRKKAVIDSESYQNLKLQFREYIENLEERLNQGLFSAVPYDTKICDKCDWNTLCRAAHL